MNTKERFLRMYEHKEADRVPITDKPWKGTLRRWVKEGMPAEVDWVDYFDVDRVVQLNVDISPRFEEKILEETDKYYITTTKWGVTMRQFKEQDSTPEMLDFKVVDADTWAQAKAQMLLEDDRIPWDYIKNNWEKWRRDGAWITAGFWFGFDVTHSWMMGTENVLIAMMEEPELVTDMFDTYLDRCEKLFGRLWDAGYHFDEITWPDDMGYKGTTFFSPEMYRQLIKPFHARAAKWAHDRGIYARLHSCGDITALVPDIMDAGLDALNPLEVKAGVDAKKLKDEFGDKLVLHGGINAVHWKDPERILAEIEDKIPYLKQNGGYIFSSDHSIPNDVSLENMKLIVDAVKRTGKY